jgi:tetratricopeptide (TPR) repeat protein
MAVYQTEERARLRRVRSEKAIQLAMQNRWQEAVELNRQLLEMFPQDVDTLNRLGKALMEIGQYADALETYREAARLDPSNTIASKNVTRLNKLVEEEAAGVEAPPPAPVDPRLFIEESGKTAVTNLVDIAPFDRIATLTAGDTMALKVEGSVVHVVAPTGQVIGQLEPKIAQRVVRLIEMGNAYAAAITSIDESHVRVIVRETSRHPSMGSRPSFPTQAPDIRSYTREGVFRADVDDEDEELLDEPEPDADPVDAAEGALDDATTAAADADADDET